MTARSSSSCHRRLTANTARRANRKASAIRGASEREGARGETRAPDARCPFPGEQFIAQIRKSNEEIDDAVISEKLDRIENVVGSILERVAEHPETAPQLDRMMDYYLPTTVKLLEAYRTLDEAAVETTSVANSKREIASTLDMLHEAFEKPSTRCSAMSPGMSQPTSRC